jgi:hypothetical protein
MKHCRGGHFFLLFFLACLLLASRARAEDRVVSPDGKFIYLGQPHSIWKYKNVPNPTSDKSANALWGCQIASDTTAIGVNQKLVAVADNTTLYVFKERDGMRLKRTPLSKNIRLIRLAFSAHGKNIIATTSTNKVIQFAAPSPDGPGQ